MKNLPARFSPTHCRGFTLVEMAVVLAIIGLLIGGLLMPLAAQMEQKNLNETRATLENVKEALLGYAMANGRYPCPAAAPASGVVAVEAFDSAVGNAMNGKCASFFNGYVPGATLGIAPANSSGYVIDGWNNPIRYAISDLSDDANATHIFTKSSGMKTANSATCAPNCGMAWIASQTLLSVCSTGTGITPVTCGTAVQLTNRAVVIVYSTGRNAATSGTGADEAANLDGNAVFVSHEPSASAATNGQFDDVVTWLSTNSIFGRLVQANQLP
jgi:prepilin-type N-terminal cleavage/methylation domain-containing protein